MITRRSLVVVAVGLLVTALGVAVAHWDTSNDLQERLNERADRVAAIIDLELERYRSASRAAAALRAADPTLDEWVEQVDRLGVAEDLASVFSTASATASPDGSSLVIDLVAPLAPNEAALGLDLFATPAAAPSAMRAYDRQLVTLSDALTLVQEPGDQAGLVVYAPWYAADGTVGGVTDIVVRGQDLLDALVPELGDLGVRITDVETADGPRVVGELVPEAGLDDGLSAGREIDVLGQQWTIDVTASVGFASTTERFGTLLTGLGLLAVSVLIGSLVHVLQRREEHALEQVEERTAALLAANHGLERALAAKDEFLAVVTHEFRTPITVIRGFAETAATGRAGELPESTQQFLSRIDRHARRLHALMDNVLTTARLQAGDLAIEPEPVDVTRLVHAVADQHQHLHPLELDLPDDVVAEVDPAHLVRVVDALLSNAGKYGRPPVAVRVRTEGEQVVLLVEDHGDGVPDDVAPRIFTAFEQADRGDMRQSRGIGLGLSVVHQLCERMGGSVRLRDDCSGACFEVRLPRAAPDEDVRMPSVASSALASDEA